MENPVQCNLKEIVRLCRQYKVRRLAVFGSAARADFESLRSDVDFIVEFEPIAAALRLNHYLGLREALGELLARPVDLIEDGAIRNPYILRNISKQQQVLYAA